MIVSIHSGTVEWKLLRNDPPEPYHDITIYLIILDDPSSDHPLSTHDRSII